MQPKTRTKAYPTVRPVPRRRHLRGDAKPRGLWWGSVMFLVVTFIRPQDLVPGLDALKLGMIASLWIAFAWFGTKERDYLADPQVKLFFGFLALLFGSIVVVVNHFWYLICVQDMTLMGIAWFLALPIVLQFPEQRRAFLRLLLLSFTFLAFWVVIHNGKGTSAFLSDENDAAAALNCALGLCFWSARLDPDKRWRLLGYLGCLLCLAGVVLSASRGGFLGMAATLMVIAMLTGKLFQSGAVIVALALLSIPFLPAGYVEEITSITDTKEATRVERIYSWNRGIDLFWKSPIFGVGANQYPWRLPEVESTPEAIAERGDSRAVGGRAAHSLYFTLIPETGIVGVSIFVAMAWIAYKRAMAWRRRTAPEDQDRRLIALFVLSGGAGAMVSGAFISTLYYPWFWFLTALTIVLGQTVVADADGRLSWPRKGPALARRKQGQRTA